MKSLRVQLLVGTALGTAAVLIVSGAVLYALISGTLRSEFDASLSARARSLMALAEQDEDGNGVRTHGTVASRVRTLRTR
jgi:Zn-dependent membrane protease YugP